MSGIGSFPIPAHAFAQILAYSFAVGVGKDLDEGVRWYRKAADAGHATAMFNLGVAYDNGEGR